LQLVIGATVFLAPATSEGVCSRLDLSFVLVLVGFGFFFQEDFPFFVVELLVSEEGDLAGVDVTAFDFLDIFWRHVFKDAPEFVGIDEDKVGVVPFFHHESVGGFFDGIVVNAYFHVFGLEGIEPIFFLEFGFNICTGVFGLLESGHHFFCVSSYVTEFSLNGFSNVFCLPDA
jgi:hypothetical protein